MRILILHFHYANNDNTRLMWVMKNFNVEDDTCGQLVIVEEEIGQD